MSHIETERLRFRKGRDHDVAAFVEIQTDERIRRYLGGPRPAAQVRSMIESLGVSALTASPRHFVVADRQTDDMLGIVLLDRRANDLPGHVDDDGNELELTYVFRHIAWGHGYAAEATRAVLRDAAAELPDQPVLVVTQSANEASLNLARCLGFRIVGTFEQYGAEQSLGVAPLWSFG